MRPFATSFGALEWRELRTANDAAQELFVSDLRDQPRGLRRFDALVSPISES
jgi:hypothetical protein